MKDFLFRLLPFIIVMIISLIVYCKGDVRYDLTSKISFKLHIKKEWMAFCFMCFGFIIILIIGILGIYFINISSTLFFVICGIITGNTIGMKNPK